MALVPEDGILKRLVSQWMPCHCHVAKIKLLQMLGMQFVASTTDGNASIPHSIAKTPVAFRVRVETAAGIVVAQVSGMRTDTVLDIEQKVANIVPQFPPLNQQLFVSGYEQHGVLENSSLFRDAVETSLGRIKS